VTKEATLSCPNYHYIIAEKPFSRLPAARSLCNQQVRIGSSKQNPDTFYRQDSERIGLIRFCMQRYTVLSACREAPSVVYWDA
jgi:hypothetical protein